MRVIEQNASEEEARPLVHEDLGKVFRLPELRIKEPTRYYLCVASDMGASHTYGLRNLETGARRPGGLPDGWEEVKAELHVLA